MMMRSVKITTPIPSLEEFGKRLGLSKARQKALMQIMTGGDLDHSIVGQRGTVSDNRRKRKSIKAGVGRRRVAAKSR
jgi:hypothetical protein